MLERNESFRELSVTERVVLFRDFLVGCWPQIDILMNNHIWDVDGGQIFDDWVETCWQLFVGREVLGERKGRLTKLAIYLPQNQTANEPLYAILARSKSNEPLIDLKDNKEISVLGELRVSGFCKAHEGGGFGLYPPFDTVTVSTGERPKVKFYRIKFNQLEFYLKEL